MFKLYEDPLALSRSIIKDYKSSGRSSRMRNTPSLRVSSIRTLKLRTASPKKVMRPSTYIKRKDSADLLDTSSDCEIYGNNLMKECGSAPDFSA